MKKLILSSMLAMFTVTSGAFAANVIDDNPMYRPDQGRFYSVTSLGTDTDFEHFGLGEEFGYGITENLAVKLKTSLSYDDNSAREFGWDYLELGLSLRYLDLGDWRGDIYGSVAQYYNTGKNFDTIETDWYNWTAGTKIGYVSYDWTLAGLIEVNYLKDNVSGFDFDAWGMKVGVEGQYVINPNWNIIGGLDYTFSLGDDTMRAVWGDEDLTAKIGINYNFDSTKFIGAYLTKEITSDFDENPMGFGVKFGIDF